MSKSEALAVARPASGPASAFSRRQMLRKTAPILVLVALCVLISALNPNFIDWNNVVRLLNGAAIPVVLVMGATFIILMGSIDLSLEGVVAITAVLASALVLNNQTTFAIGLFAVPVAIALGAGIGALNGVLHVKLRTPSFMTTLGVGFACVGLATAWLGGDTVRIQDKAFRGLALDRFLGIPASVWIAAAAVLVALVIQERTRVGRWIYAIGGDEEVAQHVGVPIGRTRILAFTIAGGFSGLAGVLSAAQFGQGHALLSQGRLFTTITAVVVGGTSLGGGVGSVLNSVVGVLIVVVLANGMVLMGVPPYVQQGVQGLLIIAAVALALDRSRFGIVK
ncbi:MAG TPA: ABC transporter permease [Methylomirabilota bacterium]|nr:ABC transporter permease [Methylomirabilota bacterium]